MGIEKRRMTIGDFNYEMTTLGAKTGQKVLLRLFRILGPAAAEVLTKGDEAIGGALTLAASATSDADLDFLTDTLAAQCSVILMATGASGITSEIPTSLSHMYDAHFAGRWSDWALWIGWGIRENFASFFAGKALENLAAQFLTDRVSRSGSPKA